jgi:hypothetical protein
MSEFAVEERFERGEVPSNFCGIAFPLGESPQFPGFRWLFSGFYAVVYICKQMKPAMKAYLAACSATEITISWPDDKIVMSIISRRVLLWRKVFRDL